MKEKSINYPKILFLSFLLFLSLSTCQRTKKNVTEVTFWHAMGGPLGDALERLINRFNSTHPEIHVESISMGNYNALSQKIMAGIMSHRIPTIAQVYSSWTTNLYASEVVEPLEDRINGENGLSKSEIEDFYPVFIRDNLIEGKLVTLPFNKSIYTYYYNMDFFREKGVDSFPETWSQLKEVARKVQNGKGAVTAFGVSVGLFESLLFSFGGKMLDSQGKPAFYSEEGIRSLEYLQNMIYRDSLALLTTGYQHQDQFIAQNIYFIMGTSVSYSFIMMNDPEFSVGVAPMPKEDTNGVLIMGTNIALFKNKPEKEKRAAWEFIKWFIKPEQQKEWALNTGYVPVRQSVKEMPEVKDFFGRVPGMKKVWKQIYYARVEPSDPEWLFGRKILSQVGLEPVLRGRMDPRKNLKRAQQEVQRVLER